MKVIYRSCKIDNSQQEILNLDKKMIKIAVDGTFEYLHDGHKKLIKKAFSIVNKGIVHIGLTSN